MKSYQEQRKWKYIIIHKGRENECKQFELDDSQRLIHKIQRQKKRSIKLAKIGFYENNKMQKFIDQVVEESPKKANKNKKLNISFINQSNSIDVFGNKDNLFLNENELDLFSMFDYGKQMNESHECDSEEFDHDFNEQMVDNLNFDINFFSFF